MVEATKKKKKSAFDIIKEEEANWSYHYSKEEMEELMVIHPISAKQQKYLNDSENDIIVWGGGAGSGKTQCSLIDLLICGWSDPDFRATVVRKTKEQMKQAGSLWDEACQMYANLGVSPRGNAMDFKFPSGAYIKFSSLERPLDKHNYQGSQCTRFLCDEGQQIPEEGILYLNSRLRSKSKAKHQLKITCNPDSGSYLCDWLVKGGYLDESGFPIKEMDGVTTYMAEIAGEAVFKPTLEDFIEEYGKEIIDEVEPSKFVFYSANIYDNPYLIKYLPSYVGKLKNLPAKERAALYEGCWFVNLNSGNWFKREWVTEIEPSQLPAGKKYMRSWDKAGTKPHAGNKDPDWTVGLKGRIDASGVIYIDGMERFRDRPAIVQERIEKAAEMDGQHTIITIPRDGGAAGIEASENSRARLVKNGFSCRIIVTRKSKDVRFEPVSIMAQEHKIVVVKGKWNDEFYDELESLDFTTHRVGKHDDIADALSDLVMGLTKMNNVPEIHLGGRRGNNARSRNIYRAKTLLASL